MDLPQTQLVSVIYALLPGFLAAWIFYGLTAYPKKSPFERVIQALIFTGIVQATVFMLRGIFLFVGRSWCIGIWTNDVAFIWSILLGVLLGIAFAFLANTDWFHKLARFVGITNRTSYTSEWFSAFNQDKRYVVLHLEGGRRLYGWPYEWPDTPDVGHFVIVQPEWLLDDNQRVPVYSVDRMLVAAKDVEMVEFEKFEPEINATEDQIKEAESKLIGLQNKEESNVPAS